MLKLDLIHLTGIRIKTKYIAFNAIVKSRLSCIRFQKGHKSWSYDTVDGVVRNVSLLELEQVLSKAYIYEASQLSIAAKYLMCINECLLGGNTFMEGQQGSDAVRRQLAKLSNAQEEIFAITSQLVECIDTDLAIRHRTYMEKSGDEDTKKTAAEETIRDLVTAVERYKRLPRLMPFNLREGREVLTPKRRGAILSNWLRQDGFNKFDSDLPLTFREEEIKPLHMARLRWCSKNPKLDQRRLSIDVIADLDDEPVIFEVKMRGDSWTFEALPQLLWYGAMMTPCSQRKRFHGLGINKIENLWLGLIMEKRTSKGYLEDYKAAIRWLVLDDIKKSLGKYFEGIIILHIDERSTGEWGVEEEHKIRFNNR